MASKVQNVSLIGNKGPFFQSDHLAPSCFLTTLHKSVWKRILFRFRCHTIVRQTITQNENYTQAMLKSSKAYQNTTHEKIKICVSFILKGIYLHSYGQKVLKLSLIWKIHDIYLRLNYHNRTLKSPIESKLINYFLELHLRDAERS